MEYEYLVWFHLKSGTSFGCSLFAKHDTHLYDIIYKNNYFKISIRSKKNKRKFIMISISEISHLEVSIKYNHIKRNRYG